MHNEPSIQRSRRIVPLQSFNPDNTLVLDALKSVRVTCTQEAEFQASQTRVCVVSKEAFELVYGCFDGGIEI